MFNSYQHTVQGDYLLIEFEGLSDLAAKQILALTNATRALNCSGFPMHRYHVLYKDNFGTWDEFKPAELIIKCLGAETWEKAIELHKRRN